MAVLEYVRRRSPLMITGLVAGGMLKVVLLLITLVNYGLCRYCDLRSSERSCRCAVLLYAHLCGLWRCEEAGRNADLLHDALPLLCAMASIQRWWPQVRPITLLGLPVRLMSYSSSLLPALLDRAVCPTIWKNSLIKLFREFSSPCWSVCAPSR